jgi:integrase
MSLTDIVCKNAKPKKKDYKLTDGEGMYLLVKSNGTRSFRLKYRINGKEKLLTIGSYPECSLLEAREKRAAARKLISQQIDPSQTKKQEKRLAVIKEQTSFESVAREWHDNNKHTWTESHARDILHRLVKDIFPEMGRRPIADIAALELLDNIRKIEKRGAHELAHRTLQYCTRIFRYAVLTKRAAHNPAIDLKGALKPVVSGHYNALESKELPDFLRCLEKNDARLYIPTSLAVKMLLLTFVRTSELINARWEEFDLDQAEWIIPAERMKMRRAHTVPLSKQVLIILEQLKKYGGDSGFVFSSQIGAKKGMSNNTILGAIRRMGYKDKTTGHGFRALAMSTIKEKLGYRHEVIDRQLAHAPENKIVAAYDRAKFLDERKKMMQEWADFIDAQTMIGMRKG